VNSLNKNDMDEDCTPLIGVFKNLLESFGTLSFTTGSFTKYDNDLFRIQLINQIILLFKKYDPFEGEIICAIVAANFRKTLTML